jgi:hypothetical protein
MTVDWNSEEAKAKWQHACDQAQQAIDKALACDGLWSALADDLVGYYVLEHYLGEERYLLLYGFASAIQLLSPVSLKGSRSLNVVL